MNRFPQNNAYYLRISLNMAFELCMVSMRASVIQQESKTVASVANLPKAEYCLRVARRMSLTTTGRDPKIGSNRKICLNEATLLHIVVSIITVSRRGGCRAAKRRKAESES